MTVNIDDIQKITFNLLSKLKSRAGNEIEIRSDYYWDILDKELYDPYQKPQNISLGQLSFDLDQINRLAQHDDDSIMYDLKRIADILKVLSIENPTAF